MKRLDSDFISQGARCAAWLYLPDQGEKFPLVIMAHGLGGERTFRLPAFAERFVEEGLAVFLFDYRNFGDSEGEPRNLINPRRHVQDWMAAIKHARTLPNINPLKIALWGTSFSGGHVLVAAAKDRTISAVVSQVPFVDGFSTLIMLKFGFILTGLSHGLRDLLRIITFRSPYYVPIVATPKEFALMNTPDALPGVMAILPKDAKWNNQAPARIMLTLPLYRPAAFAPRIACPVLMVSAIKDSLISQASVDKTASKIKDVKLERLDAGHFDVYIGDLFKRVVKLEADFLRRNLIK